MGNPKGLFALLGDLQTFPVPGLGFAPLFPDLGVSMKLVVFLLQLPEALNALKNPGSPHGMHGPE